MKALSVEIRVRNNRLRARRLALGLTQQELADKVGTSKVEYCGYETLREPPYTIAGSCCAPECSAAVPATPGGRIVACCSEHARAPEDVRRAWWNVARHDPGRFTGWRPLALRLAAFYKTTPEDLFPDDVLAVRRPVVTREVDAADLLPLLEGGPEDREALLLPSPEDAALREGAAANENEAIVGILALLDARERAVLTARFGLDGVELRTQTQIAAAQKCSKERIRQIECKALRKMRRRVRWEPFRALLDLPPTSEEDSA